MSSRTLATLIVVLLLAQLSACSVRPVAAAVAQQTAVDRDKIGVVARDPWYEFGTNPRYPDQSNQDALEQMGVTLSETGARWVRVEFIVRAGAGSFEEQIARNDFFINVVAPRHGLKVMGLLAFALVDVDPRVEDANGLLSSKYLLEGSETPYGGAVNQYMHTWLDQALHIMMRYQGRVEAYEVLNEPNRLPTVPNAYGGGEGVAPARIANLHTKLYRCFKQNQCAYQDADPSWRAGVKLILGGLHPKGSTVIVGPTGGPMSDRDYLVALFNSLAFTSYHTSYGAFPLDGIGYHPYPAEILTNLAAVEDEVARINGRLDELRSRLRSSLQTLDPGAAELPFWLTEIGYNAGYMGQNFAGQTAFLRAVFTTLTARGDVARIFWFKYEDFPPASGDNAQRWGLVRLDFSEDARCPGGACYPIDGAVSERRPAFWALRELAGLPTYDVGLPLVRR